MSDPIKILEEKKAQVLAEAQAEAAEIDKDIVALKAILSKHPEMGQLSTVSINLKLGVGKSITMASRDEAERIIREAGRPVPLGEIFSALESKGIVFNSKEPRSTLSAVLGQDARFSNIRNVGWWLAGVRAPIGSARRDILRETEEEIDPTHSKSGETSA